MNEMKWSAVYGIGDAQPFKIGVAADLLVARLENIEDKEKFIALPSEYRDEEADEVFQRTVFVRPSEIWAVSHWWGAPEDDEK